MIWSAREGLAAPARLELPSAQLPAGWRGEVSPAGVVLQADLLWHCLSSAVANGGFVQSRGFVNMHLREDQPIGTDDPACIVAAHARQRGLPGDSVGMLTGASMRSLRMAAATVSDQRLTVLLTAGLANARRAGDAAEHRALHAPPQAPGTINLALLTSVTLAPAAMAETLTTLTEAKVATLQTLGVTSPASGDIATGTGTDAIAVFCPPHGPPVPYAGKHTIFGETAARLVIEALTDSLRPEADVADVG